MAKKINMFPPIPEPPYTMESLDIPQELFQPMDEGERTMDQINRPSIVQSMIPAQHFLLAKCLSEDQGGSAGRYWVYLYFPDDPVGGIWPDLQPIYL